MRIRAGVVLLSGNKIALMKRVKPHRDYFVVPGGGVDEGEYTQDAAVREAQEELGVSVQTTRLIAVVERSERSELSHVQLYYHAHIVGGMFGSGVGEEYARGSEHGYYEALWLPLEETAQHEVYPSVLINHLRQNGLPEHSLHLIEPNDYPH